MEWVAFLRQKYPGERQYAGRLARIESWRGRHGGAAGATVSATDREAYVREVDFVSAAIDQAHAGLKEVRREELGAVHHTKTGLLTP